MPFGLDIECADCGTVRYIMLQNSQAPIDEDDEKCPRCGSVKFSKLLGSNIAWGNDPGRRSEMLKQRSFEHTKKTAKRNVERIIEKDKQKQR